jgi:glycosyltransferase involved in cell wall biosynthesis
LKNKILFILNLPPPVHGANTMGELIKNSSIINKAFDCDFINLTTSKDANDISKGSFQKMLRCLRIYINVLISLITKRYDLSYLTINSNGNGFYKDFIVVVILKLFQNKIVYHYHNKGVKKYQTHWLLNILYKYQFKNSQSILLSSLLYQDIEKYVGFEKIHICPNGIPKIPDTEINYLILNREKNLIPQLLFLSNMMVEKGVFILLEACRILNVKNIRFKMNFIGSWLDIKEEEFSEYVVKNNLENCVFYRGKKYGSAKDAYFRAADIFVFPTFYHNEAFPLVNLEAMQYGLPIISTKEGGIADMVSENETGLLINKKDSKELAEKIEYLIENPELRRKMGAASKIKFEENFRLDIFENNLVRILETIIEK